MKQRRKIYATLIVLIGALLFLSSTAIATDPLPCNNYICTGVGYFDGVKEPGTATAPVAIVNDTAYSLVLYFDTICSDLAGASETWHLMTAPHALWPTPAPYIGYNPVTKGVISLVYYGSIKLFDFMSAGAYNGPYWGDDGSWTCVITSPTL